MRFAFRRLALTDIHAHVFAASAGAEAAALQDRFWELHERLFARRQKALEDADLERYADELGLDVQEFDRARAGGGVLGRP